jgi:hypothetical protein
MSIEINADGFWKRTMSISTGREGFHFRLFRIIVPLQSVERFVAFTFKCFALRESSFG